LDNSGLEQGKFDAINIISSLGSAISKINPFAGLAVGAAAAFAAISNEAFQFAKIYEQAMLEVRTISKAANADFKGIGSDIFQLSQQTLDDPVKLAKAYYQVVSAGYDGAEGLRVLETASKAAVAGVTDTLTAADGLTTIMNAFGESAENVDQIADAMFKTVELGKTNFAQLSSSMSQAAPLAASLGVSYNEILAAVASLTKQGVPTAQAFTQIRAALIGVNKELGDGWSKAYTFQEAMQEVSERTNGSVQKLQEATGTIEAVGAILATTGKNAKGAAEDLRDIESAAGSARKAFSVMASGQINQIEILRNRVRALTESIGNELLDVANKAAGFIVDLTDPSNFAADLYQKERVELQQLRDELERGGVAQERKIEIIDILKDKYPAFLKNIQNEGEYTGDIESALIGVNEQLLKRIRLENNKEEIAKKDIAYVEKLTKFKQQEQVVQAEINRLKIASEYLRSTIKENIGRSFDDQVKAIDAKGSDASRNLLYQYGLLQGLGKEQLSAQRELNKLLGEESTARAEIIDFKPKENPDPSNIGLDDEAEAYKKYLASKKTAYEAFENEIIQLGKDKAVEINKNLLKEGEDYYTFLQNELETYKDSISKQKDIAEAAQKAGISGFTRDKNVQKVDVEIQPLVQDIKVDRTSINAIEKELSALDKKWRAAIDQAERDKLKTIIDAKKKELDLAKDNIETEISLYEGVNISLQSFTNQQLNGYIDYWNKKLKQAEKGSAKELEIISRINQGERQKWQNNIEVIKTSLNEVATVFEDAGDTITSDLIKAFKGVVSQLDNLFTALDKNASPTEKISAGVSSAITLIGLVVNASDKRKKAEEEYYLSVIGYQKQYNQLLNDQILARESINQNIFTTDYINELQAAMEALTDAGVNYSESIDQLVEGQAKLGQKNAIDWGAVGTGAGAGAALGATVGGFVGAAIGAVVGGLVGLFGGKKKKDLFGELLAEYPDLVQRSADGQEKFNKELAQTLIDQDLVNKKTKLLIEDTIKWTDQMEEARKQIEDVLDTLAGGLGNSLRDNLVTTFEQGGNAAEAMGQTISEVLENILEQLIFDEIFSEQFKKLQEEMKRSYDLGGDGNWVDDFARFFEQSKTLTDDFNKALLEAQNASEDFGFDIFQPDKSDRQGLTGEISTITEDTANVLAGAVNGIRVDVSIGLAAARESNLYLSMISVNTGQIIEQIGVTNQRLLNIEKSLS
jgi:TP901 family phage tail tape measure protein